MLEIINQKNMLFLFEISKKPRNISELAKRGDITLSVASTLISRWAKSNIVNKDKCEGERGNQIVITLTDYGKAQVKLLREIRKNYQKNKDNRKKLELVDVSLVNNPPKGCEITNIETTEKEVNDGTRHDRGKL